MKNIKEKSHASLVVHDAPGMTKRGRKHIANWLRNTAALLETKGDRFSKRFRARYISIPKVAALLLFTCLSAPAQYYAHTNISTGAVSITTSSWTNNVVFNPINLRPHSGVGLWFLLGGSSNVVISNFVVNLAVSSDGTNWARFPQSPPLQIVFTSPGAATNWYFTNLTAAQLGNARFLRITNLISSHTNGTLLVSNVQAGIWTPLF